MAELKRVDSEPEWNPLRDSRFGKGLHDALRTDTFSYEDYGPTDQGRDIGTSYYPYRGGANSRMEELAKYLQPNSEQLIRNDYANGTINDDDIGAIKYATRYIQPESVDDRDIAAKRTISEARFKQLGDLYKDYGNKLSRLGKAAREMRAHPLYPTQANEGGY